MMAEIQKCHHYHSNVPDEFQVYSCWRQEPNPSLSARQFELLSTILPIVYRNGGESLASSGLFNDGFTLAGNKYRTVVL